MDTLVQRCSDSLNPYTYVNNNNFPNGFDPEQNDASPMVSAFEANLNKEPDHFEEVLGYLTQMLMEEDDLNNKPCMLNECLALQATEKRLYEVLLNKHPSELQSGTDSLLKSETSSESPGSSSVSTAVTQWPTGTPETHSRNGATRKRSFEREEGDFTNEEPSNKQLAVCNEGSDSDDGELEMYDKVLLRDDMLPYVQNETKKPSKGGRPSSKRKVIEKEVVDLRGILTQSAQAMSNNNSYTSYQLLHKIRQHSSPGGDFMERFAHYFANAIEARLAGNGAELYNSIATKGVSAVQSLQAYHKHILTCPFQKMSNILGNRSIRDLIANRKKIHIIDFGILYGFQWPCFFQGLSRREGGPPEIRMTGIDLPRSGFRPAGRVEDTGRRLAKYCKRFQIPFEFNAVAKRFEDVQIEDITFKQDEVVVVNCIYRLHLVSDEIVVESSPRDAVLKLIKQIKPDLFIHGVHNGMYNSPFLLTRFREAIFHFSTLYDMADTTAPPDDKFRLLYEKEIIARDMTNVIACEGPSRIERPETYRQWQSRIIRAGFKQIAFNPETVKEARAKVKLNYHKDFLVDQDNNWVLQGWKGRVLRAISLWKPIG